MTVTDAAKPHLGGNIHGGDDRTWCPAVWQAIINGYRIGTMLDVGCGEGHAVQWFREHGVEATGFDGLQLNVDNAVTQIEKHDLVDGPFIDHAVDFVWCCEVVEHVAEEHIQHLLVTLSGGRIIAMTHAVPGQGGHHHVNCQDAAYWISRMQAMGYYYAEGTTHMLRGLSEGKDGNTYFAKTGLIFVDTINTRWDPQADE